MTYFTGNVQYEKQGLLSPRKSTDSVKQVAALNVLRFLAVVHFITGKYFVGRPHNNDTWYEDTGRNIKTWGFTQINFLVLLSGFVLAMTYAPTLTDGSGPGYSVRNFLVKRICWLYPVFLISLFLRVWDEPRTYTGRFRLWLKFAFNASGLSGYWPPSFRTYSVNDVAWSASIFLTMYVLIMPLFLKPIHKTLSKVSRTWLLVFMWPWTMFFGFVVERIDILMNDGTTHWDWNNPVFYIPTFLMGITAGSIFVDREDEKLIGFSEIGRRFGGSFLFLVLVIVMATAKVDPMYHWHQVGSLSLIEAYMIYLFASGKDVVMGMVFRMKPVRAVAGLASTAFIMQSATNHFAKQIAWKYDWTFFISLLSFAIVMRLFVEIPYARTSLSFFESKFGSK